MNQEKILNIEEITNIKQFQTYKKEQDEMTYKIVAIHNGKEIEYLFHSKTKLSDDSDKMSGYLIITTNQVIILAIDNTTLCCEDWGYFMSEDDFDDFVGTELFNIKITDTFLNKEKLKKELTEEVSVMFIDLETNKGVLQFTAYNEHNGYYGHMACVCSTQLKYLTEL